MKTAKKYLFVIPLILFFVLSREFLQRPLWFDEALTRMNFALLPLEKIYTSYFIPNNHIGYTMLLHLWYTVIPQTVMEDVWSRLLSFLLGTAFILFSWMTFKRFIFRTALCCFAVSMPFLIYASSVRGYMAALLFSMTTVYCACRFAKVRSLKNGICFFLSSLCCVSVLPSNLFVLGAAVIYAIPLCGKDFYRKKSFYLVPAIPIAAFLVFWLPLSRLLIKASRLGEGWHDRLHSLGAGLTAFSACAALIVLFALLRIVIFRKKADIKDIRVLVFATVLPLVFLAKVAPFPRVYFPFFGIFLLTASGFAARTFAWIRRQKIMPAHVLKTIFAVSAVGLTLYLNFSPAALNILSRANGSADRDDFFLPWYSQKQYVPHETAKRLSKEDFNICYLSFSSDPWSVMFYSSMNKVDVRKFRFDGPRGRVAELPDNSIVVINKTESVSGLVERFGGVFEMIAETAMHRIYRYRY